MQKKRSKASKIPANSFEQQNRAIVNLKQLSESPWHQPYEDNTINSPVTEDKLNTNTHESTELPLNPKQKHYESPLRNKFKSIPVDRSRPNTIQHLAHQPEESFDTLRNKNVPPLTSLNFYDDVKRSFNTFDDRSRLNDEIQMFASRIKQEGKLIKSIELSRAKASGLNQPNNTSISFKNNIARRSFFYKQFKDFLYSSFKVDGKPVEIKRDKYSIESHGLPKKKSIYSFKEKNVGDFFAFNKTDVLRKKVTRYDMESEETKEVDNVKKKSTSLYDERFSLSNRSLDMRRNQKDSLKRQRGKLIRGRPPTTLVCNED